MTTIIQDKEFAEQKLRSAIRLTDGLLAGDWPYEDSKEALKRIRKSFHNVLDDIIKLDEGANAEVIKAHCNDARYSISQYMGFIGFITYVTLSKYITHFGNWGKSYSERIYELS
jgi:hypothetical protein